ncbi:hypothetical protein H310_15307 [Aphanomyces invadans]|uniref:Chromo domain-containing protein n=1 Tax=Aphanomyces invadans TaxID=157072 RepID=A0A024T7P1_9STRA|nr:hypothetical protein H310_15307 [Aphanomyces invadans]ETV89854.1 hypothetical protein H310_15307 [Aphanomyces invadans]|eukprot:XP_008881514.1 hypothetical protein H310_15307 [Aphanomyces invadans]
MLDDARVKHMAQLKIALDQLLREVFTRSDKLRQQARGRCDKNTRVKFANFSVGDFVLVGTVVQRPTKLALQLRGPQQVVRVVTDHVMETQQLLATFDLSTHHACRLKMYHEGGRECVLRQTGRYKVLVKWLGLDAKESSWEPVDNLLEDIPIVLRKWCAAHKDEDHVADMMAHLDLP